MGEENNVAVAVDVASASRAALHVLVLSFPSQGNLNPMLRLAKRIAAKGPLVTFSSTGFVATRVGSSAGAAATADGIPIGLGRLRYEFLDDGDHDFKTDNDGRVRHLQEVSSVKMAELIRRQAAAGRPVSCVINNCFHSWAIDITAAMGIPCGVLWVQSAALQAIYYHYRHTPEIFPHEHDSSIAAVSLAGVPTFTFNEMPTYLLGARRNSLFTEEILKQFDVIKKVSWVFANTFVDMERDAIAAHAALGTAVIPVGPLVDLEDSDGAAADTYHADVDCIAWLNQQPPRSVVFISFGSSSIAAVSNEEMAEMAAALRSSGKRFLWVLRADVREHVPEGFIADVTGDGKGVIVTWSPQWRVLNHGATGCFMTHCGWNSTVEAVSAGVPVIAFPMWGDQPMDAKFLVEHWGVGVRLKAPVRREEMAAAIEAVMDGPDAPAMRERAAAWSAAARAAISDGGSSDKNVQAFVDELAAMAGASSSHREA